MWWNYYYPFDSEIQLDSWKILNRNPDGSVRVFCEVDSSGETDKILLWAKNRQGISDIYARVPEINGKNIRYTHGFYIGPHTERQGLRIHFQQGKNRI